MNNRLQHVLNHIVKKEKPRQFLYLLKCCQFYKVGVAFNVQHRLSLLQIGNPFRIELVTKWHSRDAKEDERRIHNMLLNYRVRGEWFELPADFLADLLKLAVANADRPTVSYQRTKGQLGSTLQPSPPS